MNAALTTTTIAPEQPDFTINGNELFVNTDSSDLDAYMWQKPDNSAVFFVFIENYLHIVTLEDGEAPFTHVRTRSESVTVMPVNDQEIAEYAAQADRILAEHAREHQANVQDPE